MAETSSVSASITIFNLLSMATIWELVCATIYTVGVVAILVFLYENFKSLVCIVKAMMEPYFQPQLPQNLADKFGKWAVVTGATDGIGKEYSRELAKLGINIVLISRTKEKLVAVANELESEYKVKTKYIIADFAKGREVYAHIEQELSGIPVGILVNNVGKMYDYPDDLDLVPDDVIWDMININVAAVTAMSRLVIPQMKKQRKGAIVNISSASEMQAIPLMAVYAASKRYVKSLTQALKHELAEYNITIQNVAPFFLVTKMNQYSNTVMRGGLLIPDVKSFTRSLVFTLGKTSETTGYWSHGLQYFLSNLCPEWLRIRVAHKMTRSLRGEYLTSATKNA